MYYARTFNWSSTGVATGAAPVTTQFKLPAGHVITDFASVTVIANGIPSQPVSLFDNDTLGTATVLGSIPKITLTDMTIDSATDVDFYKFTAEDTGKAVVNIFFGNLINQPLDMRVWDARGNIVATGALTSNITPGMDRVGLVIPVVTQQDYYVEVFSSAGNVNAYSLEIENLAAPVPTEVTLDPVDDSGLSADDLTTFRTTQLHYYVHADLNDFAASGVPILEPAQAAAGLMAGAAVQVLENGVSVGFADVVLGTLNTIFEIRVDADLAKFPVGGPNAAGPAGYRGFLNFVTAAVKIFDNQKDAVAAPAPASARTQLSDPLRVTADNTAPIAPSAPDLLASSDSGASNTDNVTYVSSPAFQGTGETNTRVRIRGERHRRRPRGGWHRRIRRRARKRTGHLGSDRRAARRWNVSDRGRPRGHRWQLQRPEQCALFRHSWWTPCRRSGRRSIWSMRPTPAGRTKTTSRD